MIFHVSLLPDETEVLFVLVFLLDDDDCASHRG